MPVAKRLEIVQLHKLDRAKSAEFAQDAFSDWVVSNWFWFALDGGGGVGKSEAQKYVEQFGMGISAGDYFRGANRILTNLGYTPEDVKDIHRELHNIIVTTKIIKGVKKISLRYKREGAQLYDPDGSGDDGLRNPDLPRSMTDFLSSDPVAVGWWKRQVRKTLKHAAGRHKPVISVGRTYREIRQDKREMRDWRAHLSSSVFGYIYANREVLAQRSTSRALKEYPNRSKNFEHMSKEEFVNYLVASDWERTVLEMTRTDEQLARPRQAYELQKEHVYDFVLNTSHLKIAEVNALHSSAIMAFISKYYDSALIYQTFYELLQDKFDVSGEDPEISTIEEQISETFHQLHLNGELETA